ncbi:hypothetical protein D3C83_136420 [compost metagenome]
MIEREAGTLIGARTDQIKHRFRLSEIEPSVEKCALGKFSRFSLARAFPENQS